MTIQPRDMNVFFDQLGEGYVRRGLVNDEFTGKDLKSAERWLAQRGVSWTRILNIGGLSLTGVGVVSGIVFGIGRLFGWGS